MTKPAAALGDDGTLGITLRRAKAGDLEAFGEIVRLYQRRVLALAYRLTGRVEDAQDAAQDAFLRLQKNLGRVRENRDIWPWLSTVTVNICRDVARSRKSSKLVAVEPREYLGVAGTGPDPERLLARRQDEDRLQAALQKLSEHERTAIVLRELEGLTTAEVAARLGSLETTVRSQICKARLKLRRLLEGKRES